MVITKVATELIKYGSRYAKQIVDIDYKILRASGYKHAAAKGISHGTFGGSIGNYYKNTGLDTMDGTAEILQSTGDKTSVFKKGHSRRRRKPSRRITKYNGNGKRSRGHCCCCRQ